MTKDGVHAVGHSPVCQILLQIVTRAVITSSPPAWTSSAGMPSIPAEDGCGTRVEKAGNTTGYADWLRRQTTVTGYAGWLRRPVTTTAWLRQLVTETG